MTQFFDQNSQLVLLLVNTLLSDLKSDNFINGASGRGIGFTSKACGAPMGHPAWLPSCHVPAPMLPCVCLHAVTTGLVVCTKLIGPDLINAVYPVVVERLRHPKEHVRKKAVMALHRFHQLDPKHEGPLAGIDLDKHFRTMLCDKVGGGNKPHGRQQGNGAKGSPGCGRRQQGAVVGGCGWQRVGYA